jgi:predicted Zn-dependent protease
MTTELLDLSLRKLLLGALRVGIHLGATDDAMAVLKVLRMARPLEPLLVMTEAMQLLQQGHPNAARMTLEEADECMPGSAVVKAALAWVLASQGDGLWQAYADEVKALPADDVALRMVASIEKSVRNESDEDDRDAQTPSMADPNPAYLSYTQMGVAC